MNVKPILQSRLLTMLKATVNDWLEDNALRLSAALAYYSIFSIAPLLIIAITIAGFVLGPEAVKGQLADQLKTYIGSTAAASVQSMVQSAAKPSDGIINGLLGFAALFLGASGIFGQLKDALNTIWEVRLKPGGGIKGFMRERLLSFGMVLVIGFLLLTSLLASTALAAFSGYI
ncbi:MAG: YhjD/YihY/BrkB family envelope integrity protein, partial [Chthoniobacteraceae bacterium]